jgi:hypothetical protein
VARAVAVQPGGRGAYVLDAYGGVHAAGGADPVAARGYWPGWDVARDIGLVPGFWSGGYVLDAQGGLHRFGDRVPAPRTTWSDPSGRARSLTFLPGGTGGYVTDDAGNLHPFAVGRAPMPRPLAAPIPLPTAAVGTLVAGSGPVSVTAGGAEIGVEAACATAARWGRGAVLRAVVAG